MINSIFCDINGVMFKQTSRFSVRYSEKFNIPIEILNQFLDGDMDLCLTGKRDLKDELAKYLNLWKWKGSIDELLQFWFDEGDAPNMKFLNLLKILRDKGLKLYLATQNEQYRTEKYLNLLKPLLDYDVLLPTYLIGYKKSNPLYFKACLNKCNIQPNEVVLIDNNEKAINSAKSLGISTILFTTEDQAIEELKKLLLI